MSASVPKNSPTEGKTRHKDPLEFHTKYTSRWENWWKNLDAERRSKSRQSEDNGSYTNSSQTFNIEKENNSYTPCQGTSPKNRAQEKVVRGQNSGYLQKKREFDTTLQAFRIPSKLLAKGSREEKESTNTWATGKKRNRNSCLKKKRQKDRRAYVQVPLDHHFFLMLRWRTEQAHIYKATQSHLAWLFMAL